MENPCVECYQEVVDNVDIVFKQIQFKRKCALSQTNLCGFYECRADHQCGWGVFGLGVSFFYFISWQFGKGSNFSLNEMLSSIIFEIL